MKPYRTPYMFKFLRIVTGLVLLFLLITSDVSRSLAQGIIHTSTTRVDTPYFTLNALVMADGRTLDEMVIHGPPTPPPGTESARKPVNLTQVIKPFATQFLPIPAYAWSFGCSATSGAMIAAYFDRNGYDNFYTGPTNGGVMPLASTAWPNWTDSYGDTWAQCPLTASRNGLDGRTIRGSIDDYWVSYDSNATDPYLTNGWSQHVWGDSIGDYMKTSQSSYDNTDGATSFYNYSSRSDPLTCATMESAGIASEDGTYGRKLFYEARGYTVTECYNQKTNNNGGAFTFASYMAEIDAGRPVMINLAGHTVVGVGYDDTTQTVYIHDTWDTLTHSFIWGTSYAGMTQLSVSIVNLAPLTFPGSFSKLAPGNGTSGVSTSPALSWYGSSGATSYEYCYDTLDNSACDGVWVTGILTNGATLNNLANNTTYYWQVRARNAAGVTQSNGGTWWSFTTQVALPGPFGKSSPSNGATGISPTGAVLNWQSSAGADSYEYCLDATNDNACDHDWVTGLSATSVELGLLDHGITYYWQVRANNAGGATDANSGVWWSLTTQAVLPLPGAFGKTSPANGATQVPVAPTLTWEPSSGAVSYEFQCIGSGVPLTPPCDETWQTVGSATSVTLSGLRNYITYSWRVLARNASGITVADSGSYWSFTTAIYPPAAFSKQLPSNQNPHALIDAEFRWSTSSWADLYELCIDTTANSACDTTWSNVGLVDRYTPPNLSYLTTYYWQIRAVNAGGVMEADGGEWWSMTTTDAPPGAFHKLTPQNGTADVPGPVVLSWETSARAIGYSYCYDTVDDQECTENWISAGQNTQVSLPGLQPGAQYYWNVRSENYAAATLADGGSWWSFTTEVPIIPPGAFGKIAPLNGASGVNTAPVLSWNASSGAVSYEYCYDTSDNSTCDGSWTSTPSTSASLTGLANATAYFWQVRALNQDGSTEADSAIWWQFTTIVTPPGAFGKESPGNGATLSSLNPTITWEASNRAVRYEYCIDTSDNTSCDGTWLGTDQTRATLSGLLTGVSYSWQVRAVNPGGTIYADGGTWWSFSYLEAPGAFSKLNPPNDSINNSVTPMLSWSQSNGATVYDYCIDTMNNGECDNSWVSIQSTSVLLTELSPGTQYFWQVRSENLAAMTYADGGTWWSFTTLVPVNPPGGFSKASPQGGATGIGLSPNLSWDASSDANSYEYCYDTINNSTCDSDWITSQMTSASLTGLAFNTTYHWQVRAVNQDGRTEANSGIWWRFTTQIAPPEEFSKTSPANGLTLSILSPTLTWNASDRAEIYQFCVDQTPDDECSTTWLDDYATHTTLAPLPEENTYYWQVRAVNSSGITYADGGTWWSFTTPAPPEEFHKLTPPNQSEVIPDTTTFSWTPLSEALAYEYCLDTIYNRVCDSSWIPTQSTTVIPTGLAYGTHYFWQVRAIRASEVIEADSDHWWMFDTISLPGSFTKVVPLNDGVRDPTNLTLLWDYSPYAEYYEYCVDLLNDGLCNNTWISSSQTSVTLPKLADGKRYFWQVRAINSGGTTYADGGTWWSFSTPPPVFDVFLPAIQR